MCACVRVGVWVCMCVRVGGWVRLTGIVEATHIACMLTGTHVLIRGVLNYTDRGLGAPRNAANTNSLLHERAGVQTAVRPVPSPAPVTSPSPAMYSTSSGSDAEMRRRAAAAYMYEEDDGPQKGPSDSPLSWAKVAYGEAPGPTESPLSWSVNANGGGEGGVRSGENLHGNGAPERFTTLTMASTDF